MRIEGGGGGGRPNSSVKGTSRAPQFVQATGASSFSTLTLAFAEKHGTKGSVSSS